MITHAEVKIFVEGIELKQFGTVTLYYGSVTAPSLQLTTPLTKNIRKLVAGTIIQCFVRSVSEDPRWFWVFEGSLSKITFYRTDSSENATLVANGTESILEKYKHAKYNITNPVAGIATDVVFANIGNRGDVNASLPFKRMEGTGISQNFLSLESWNNFSKDENITYTKDLPYAPAGIFGVEGVKTEGAGGFPAFIRNVFIGTTLNNPYIRIINDSLKFIDRTKIYPNDTIYKLALQVQAFNDLRQSIVSGNSSISYRGTIDQILNIGFAELNYIGIPSLNSDDKIVSSIIMPINYYIPPPIYNVILPNEYRNYQINFNFDTEPTRAMNSTFTDNFGAALGLKSGNTTIMPTFLAPVDELIIDGAVNKDGKSQYYIKFTEEEKYRGLNPLILSSTIYEASYALFNQASDLDVIILTEEQLKEEANKKGFEANQGLFTRMLYITETGYRKARLDARGIGTLTIPYFNPNWMIGFPGLVVTPDHGPILVMFDSMTVNISANGSTASVLSISKPRFLNDIISMDWPAPKWYDSYMSGSLIGKAMYKDYSKYPDKFKNGASITDYLSTNDLSTPIESAATVIHDDPDISFETRKRKFVDNFTYFKFLKVKVTGDGFPSPSVTEYREAKNLDALTIGELASNSPDTALEYLECPYVLERAKKVSEWLGLDINFKTNSKFTPPDPIDPTSLDYRGTEPDSASEMSSGSTSNLEPNPDIDSNLLLQVGAIAEEIVLSPTAPISPKYKMSGTYQMTVDDIRKGRGIPYNGKDVVNLNENIIKLLIGLYEAGVSFRVTKVISAHSITTNSGKISAHCKGNAIDLVGVTPGGIPDRDLTTVLNKWLQSHKSQYNISTIWYPNYSGNDTRGDVGAHSPVGFWGMHIHVKTGY